MTPSEPQLGPEALDQLFRDARSAKFFADRPVPDDTLLALYDLAKLAPSASNTCPMRLVFVRSDAGRARLVPTLMAGNVPKVQSAPVTVIVAYDLEFYTALPTLAPHMDVPSQYAGQAEDRRTAFCLRNSSLQAGFLMVAARSLGLDCGPMSGFRNAELDAAFFAGTSWRSNFLINIGYRTDQGVHDRAARLTFDQACRLD